MAMIPCFECDKPVADSAETCPKCGAGVERSVWEHNHKIVHETIEPEVGGGPGYFRVRR